METIRNIQYLEHKNTNPNAPILMLLHGYGSNEQDLFGFKSDLANYFNILSLRGIKNTPMGGYCWYDLFPTANGFDSDSNQAKLAVEQVVNFIKDVQNQYQNSQKVWLAGFSQGAILSYAIALNQPQMIAKVICLSGYLDKRIIKEPTKECTNLEFFISHGKDDLVIPIEKARTAAPFLNSHQISNQYKEYQSGHGLNQANYQDMIDWMVSRVN